jgi:hypothetical protein
MLATCKVCMCAVNLDLSTDKRIYSVRGIIQMGGSNGSAAGLRSCIYKG